MKQYQELLKKALYEGVEKEDRTGTGTLSLFGTQTRYKIDPYNFPLVTTKKVFWKGVVHELLWFISGNTNIEYLQENDVHIWDEWADKTGELGPVYGRQWRSWWDGYQGSIDQLKNVIDKIKTNPDSRRLIVSSWNVGQLDSMALPPCHMMFQFYVSNGELSCHLYQRSGDLFLGVPFNIASYSLLTMMVAHVTGLRPGEFIHTIGDAHIYKNHLGQVFTQLRRRPLGNVKVSLNTDIEDIDEFTYEDINLDNYPHWPAIKAPVAV